MGTRERGVPTVVFVHREPIRRHHLRSHDLLMGFQPSDARASKMVAETTKFDVLPPLEEWRISLEVGSQVYQLLKRLQATSESDSMA